MTSTFEPCLCGDPLCCWCGDGPAEDPAGAFDPAAGVDPDDPGAPVAQGRVGATAIFDARDTWNLPGIPVHLSGPVDVFDICADTPTPLQAVLVLAGTADVADDLVPAGTWIVQAPGRPRLLSPGDFAERFRAWRPAAVTPLGVALIELVARKGHALAAAGIYVPADIVPGTPLAAAVGRAVLDVVLEAKMVQPMVPPTKGVKP